MSNPQLKILQQYVQLSNQNGATHVYRIAHNMGVFKTLLAGSGTLESIATACQAPVRPLQLLLNALCEIGVVQKFADDYVLAQVMQHDRSVKGEVDFSIDGAQDGAEVTYALEQLLPADADSTWSFSFRYFQDFDRELILPAGFIPEKVNVEVISRTKSIASVKQSFVWGTGQS